MIRGLSNASTSNSPTIEDVKEWAEASKNTDNLSILNKEAK